MENPSTKPQVQSKKESFKLRFGEKIVKAGIIPVPVSLLFIKKLGLKYSDFFLICLILSKSYDGKHPYFSLKKVSRTLGICQDTLHKSKNRLKRQVYLETRERTKENKRGKGRNSYDLAGLRAALENIIDLGQTEILNKNLMPAENNKFPIPSKGMNKISDLIKNKKIRR